MNRKIEEANRICDEMREIASNQHNYGMLGKLDGLKDALKGLSPQGGEYGERFALFEGPGGMSVTSIEFAERPGNGLVEGEHYRVLVPADAIERLSCFSSEPQSKTTESLVKETGTTGLEGELLYALKTLHELPIEHDENGHAFKRIRCRSVTDHGAELAALVERYALPSPQDGKNDE